MKSFLDIVSECDSFPYSTTPKDTATLSTFWRFTHSTTTSTFTLGYISPLVAQALHQLPSHLAPLISLNTPHRTISLTATTPATRSSDLSSILTYWRLQKTSLILSNWRSERYAIYCPTGTAYASIERAGAPLFGVVAYCVYLICYSKDEKGGEIKIWISRRAASKREYAGFFDVTAAGAMADTDASALECVAREAAEEASLPVSVVRDRAAEVGSVRYCGLSDGVPGHGGGEEGLCCPEVGTVFEMDVGTAVPVPSDGEVEGFYLWSVGEVRDALKEGRFKGNSGAVMGDWLRGRGLLGDEGEGVVGEEIERRMRRVLDFPVM